MRKQVNVGIIGIGRLGSVYTEFLTQRVPGAKVMAVADLIPKRASEIAEKFDIPKWYDNHHDLNCDPNVDAVVVTATTGNHKEIVIDAANQQKAIFCEKPMALNLEDAYTMQKVISTKKVFYQQGYMRRFDKAFAGAKHKIDQGVIGSPVVFRGSSRDPFIPPVNYLLPENSGGQIIDMAIHDLDIARWYMGDIKTVYAVGGVFAYPEIRSTGDTDNVVMAITFNRGTLGEIDISRNGVYGYDIRAEVLGTKGALKAGYLRDTPILVMTAEGVNHDVVPYFPQRFKEAYIDQLNDYIENLLNNNQPTITVEDGVKGLQAAVAATMSLKTNQIVIVADY